MKPAPFAYHAPETFEVAVALLAKSHPKRTRLAVGQSLVPAMAFLLARPPAPRPAHRSDGS